MSILTTIEIKSFSGPSVVDMDGSGEPTIVYLNQGPEGQVNSLTIGTVEEGETASATITGDAPDQTLNLVLPKGDSGEAGEPGPNIIIQGATQTELVGFIYGDGGVVNGSVPSQNFTPSSYGELAFKLPQYDGIGSLYVEDRLNFGISQRSGSVVFPSGTLDNSTFSWVLPDSSGTISLEGHEHDASDITSGIFNNARINFASPSTIGSGTPNSGAFTTLSATGTATLPHIHGSLAGDLYIHVRNTSGAPLTRGTPVYIVGNVGNTDRIQVAPADNTNSAKMPAIGLLDQDLAHNADGDAVILGELPSANTNAYTLNQELFVGVGALTGTKPTTGEVQSVGVVSRVQTNTGVIVVNIQGRKTPDSAFAQAVHTHVASAISDSTTAGRELLTATDHQAQITALSNITNTSSTSITLTASDSGNILRCTSSSAVTINMPSTDPAGNFSLAVIRAGTGTVTFAANGKTLNSYGNLFSIAGQHAWASVIRVEADTYNLSGTLA